MRIKSLADEYSSFPDTNNGGITTEKKGVDTRLDMTGATSSGVSSMGNEKSLDDEE